MKSRVSSGPVSIYDTRLIVQHWSEAEALRALLSQTSKPQAHGADHESDPLDDHHIDHGHTRWFDVQPLKVDCDTDHHQGGDDQSDGLNPMHELIERHLDLRL